MSIILKWGSKIPGRSFPVREKASESAGGLKPLCGAPSQTASEPLSGHPMTPRTIVFRMYVNFQSSKQERARVSE